MPRSGSSRRTDDESPELIASIREAIEEFDNGGGRVYEGEEGLKQFFRENPGRSSGRTE